MQEMTAEEKTKLTDLKKCDFSEMSDYFKAQSEARKAMTKEEKLVSCFGNYIKTKSDFVCIFIYFLLIYSTGVGSPSIIKRGPFDFYV